MTEIDPRQIVEFWQEIGREGWFKRDDALDETIRERFGALHARAAAGEFEDWRREPESCLALILVLDQFSRNMFRDDPRAFAQDEYACEIALQAIADGHDGKVQANIAIFFYMPLIHSESILQQDRAILLAHAIGNFSVMKFARIHRDVIARFGRFPHRNPVLGRHTTPAERQFLESGGFGA